MDYINMWKDVILKPSDFFRKMPTTGKYTDSLVFALINNIIFLNLVVLFNNEIRNGVSNILRSILSSNTSIFFSIYFILWTIVTTLSLSISSISIRAAIFNASYKLLGGTGSYGGSVRVISYTSALMVLTLIPLVGWIFSLYGLYLYVVGGMFVHHVSMWKSIIAIFLPILLFFLLIFLLANIGT